MTPTDIGYYAPSLPQIVLAIVCVAIVQKLKLTDRFPWLTEYTDSSNRLASLLIAVVITMCIHWRDMILMDKLRLDHADWIILGKDAGVQWVVQLGVYKVGIKDSLKTLFTMLGIGPPAKTSMSEVHTTAVTPEGATIKTDVVATVTEMPKPPDAGKPQDTQQDATANTAKPEGT